MGSRRFKPARLYLAYDASLPGLTRQLLRCMSEPTGSTSWPARGTATLYVGVTASDIARRAYEHRTGAADGFTQRYGLKLLDHC